MVIKYRSVNAYWHHVGLFFDQYDGLITGYNEAAEETKDTIPHGDIFWMNVFGDLEDLEQG
jgi:hypothetical protein